MKPRNAIVVLALLSPAAHADPLTVISIPLGKSQSECFAEATERVKALVPNVDHGSEKGANRVVFGSDKPYYLAVLCEGNTAFFAISGPDPKVRAEKWQKFQKAKAAPAKGAPRK